MEQAKVKFNTSDLEWSESGAVENDFTVLIPSNSPEWQDVTHQAILKALPKDKHDSVVKFDGTGYASFSKLANDCILSARTQIIIICSDRHTPSSKDFDKMLSLLEEGYGLVGLYKFGFFGFSKYLIKRIGFFDERFFGGNYEDDDLIKRLQEANIAYYESGEVSGGRRGGSHAESTWPVSESRNVNHLFYHAKWRNPNNIISREIPEPKLPYDIGDCSEREFLPWDKSVLVKWRKEYLNQPREESKQMKWYRERK